jgi:FlaA1/EpsC-like NDP-sugar epimerase
MANFSPRTLLAMLHDLCAAALAWALAYELRFDFVLPPEFSHEMLHTLIWVAPLQSVIFWGFGLYRGMWRYASVNDLRRISLAVLFAAGMISMTLWMFRVEAVVPRSVLVISPVLLLLIMGGSRFVYRLWREQGLYHAARPGGEPVLIMGSGDAAVNLSKELARSKDWRPVGFLDNDTSKLGHTLNGIRVLGTLNTLPELTGTLNVRQVIIAMPEAPHRERKQAIELCSREGIKALTVPSFDDLLSGRVAVSQLRAVELDDLLGRDPVLLDDAGLHGLLGGNAVLVTGAGGSIGSELCRQILRYAPRTLVLLDSSEFALYTIEQELLQGFPQLQMVFLAGDVRDAARVEEVLARWQPAVIFHAAAYKHVPLMEVHNAGQAVRNNVLGTWTLASAAQRHGVKKFVMMGATKRLSEMVCQGLQQDQGTRFVMVRFGNVLGSNGSVIPRFREQIAKGGPVTVTHPEINRYFMSIPEAAQLVLQAGLMGQGGEIFVLDMGEPVKIVDLARDMIRLSGFSEEDIRIEFTGLRPGEKLYEELLADNEHTLPTPHPKLRIARARAVDADGLKDMLALIASHATLGDAEVRDLLRQWVPEYAPNAQQG